MFLGRRFSHDSHPDPLGPAPPCRRRPDVRRRHPLIEGVGKLRSRPTAVGRGRRSQPSLTRARATAVRLRAGPALFYRGSAPRVRAGRRLLTAPDSDDRRRPILEPGRHDHLPPGPNFVHNVDHHLERHRPAGHPAAMAIPLHGPSRSDPWLSVPDMLRPRVILRADALRSGLNSDDIQGKRRRREWVSLRSGVYVEASRRTPPALPANIPGSG